MTGGSRVVRSVPRRKVNVKNNMKIATNMLQFEILHDSVHQCVFYRNRFFKETTICSLC